MVRPRLEGRFPADAVVGLVGHHRLRLQPAGDSALHDRGDEVLGTRGRCRRLPVRCGRVRTHRFLEQRPQGTRCHQAGLYVGRMGVTRSARRGFRHDLCLAMERGDAQDRHGRGRRGGALHLLLMERQGSPARHHAHVVRQQSRQERLGGHGVRAVRRRVGDSHRPVGHQRGDAAHLQRAGSRQSTAAGVLRSGSHRLAAAPTGRSIQKVVRPEARELGLVERRLGRADD